MMMQHHPPHPSHNLMQGVAGGGLDQQMMHHDQQNMQAPEGKGAHSSGELSAKKHTEKSPSKTAAGDAPDESDIRYERMDKLGEGK